MPLPRIAIVGWSVEGMGGQSAQAHALVRQLQQEGYAVSFIPMEPRFPSGLQWVRRYPYVRTLLNQLLYLPSLLRLRRAEVMHVFSASYWSFLLSPLPAIIAGRMMGKRIVLHYHSGQAEDHLARWGMLVHPWLRLVDEIVVPSEYLRRIFARHGYRARVIPNTVDTSRFRYRERARLRPRLLSTRNFERHYRVDVTLEAFALLKARFPDATLTVAGHGSQEGELRRLAGSLGTSGIRFLGAVRPPAVPGLYDEADIFVNSSVVDNQPVSVLEAFASGLPVVSTSTGDLASLVRDGETGLVVPSGDPAATAKAIATLIEHPDRALLMAQRAKREVEQYTWPRVHEKWATVYADRAE
ncbi:MAG: glycosyltransferase family 4 protein [Nitrospirae bacterium]|nr:MAG: glycosyltransferase family 4 protein [Nitrospirota bacterium]